MKNNKLNKYIRFGLVLNIIIMSSKQFIEIPDGIYCFGMGVGIAMIIYGAYITRHDTTKVKMFKRNLVKKIIKLR